LQCFASPDQRRLRCKIKIIRAHEFIQATPEGLLDLEQSKKVLVQIASASAQSIDHNTILDTRQAQSALTAEDLWDLSATLGTFRKEFSGRLAVLCPLERFDLSAFFALCAEDRGFQVKAFTSFEEAMEWLMARPVLE